MRFTDNILMALNDLNNGEWKDSFLHWKYLAVFNINK